MDWLWGRCQGMVNFEPRLGLGDVPWGALWGSVWVFGLWGHLFCF